MTQQMQIAQRFRSLPSIVQQQAAVFWLGYPNAVYQPTLSNPFAVIAVFIGLIVLDVFAIAFIWSLGYSAFGLLLVPILLLIRFVPAFLNSNLRVYVFTEGLIRAKGKSIDVIRWDQVASVKTGIRRRGRSGYTYTYTVYRRDGAVYEFGPALSGAVLLGKTIEEETKKRQPV